MKMISKLAALLLLGATALGATAQQANWPNRPVRLVVPFTAGGSSDGLARTVAQKLSEKWGQPVNVDNKPGGYTVIAAMEAVRAAPDGYTLFQPVNSTLTMNPFAASKLPYDPFRDFTYISKLTTVPLGFVVGEKLPVKTIQEFIAYAKAHPDQVTVGGGAVGAQLQVEQFGREWGVKFRYVPYKAGTEIAKALLSGDIDAGIDGAALYRGHIKTGKVRMLATTGTKRLDTFDGAVPALGELGLEKVELPTWYALIGPAKMPDSIRNKIAADLKDVMAMPDVRAKMTDLGLQTTWSGPDELVQQVRKESAVIGPLIKELGIKFD